MSTNAKNSKKEIKAERKLADNFEPKLNVSIWYN